MLWTLDPEEWCHNQEMVMHEFLEQVHSGLETADLLYQSASSLVGTLHLIWASIKNGRLGKIQDSRHRALCGFAITGSPGSNSIGGAYLCTSRNTVTNQAKHFEVCGLLLITFLAFPIGKNSQARRIASWIMDYTKETSNTKTIAKETYIYRIPLNTKLLYPPTDGECSMTANIVGQIEQCKGIVLAQDLDLIILKEKLFYIQTCILPTRKTEALYARWFMVQSLNPSHLQ